MSEDPILFRARAPKRRKVFRSRPADNDDLAQTTSATATIDGPPTTNDNDNDAAIPSTTAGSSLQALLRQKRLLKSRRGGIGFTQSPNVDRSTPVEVEDAAEAEEEIPTALAAAASRFAIETGQKAVSNDNVMMSYIDSEIAKLRTSHTSHNDGDDFLRTDIESLAPPQRQPAAIGKIMEIDLGSEAFLTNAARTEIARRRAAGEMVEEKPATPVKVRLGRDGKPRRKRWQRASEDIKRDDMVEALMKETKLGVYEEAEPLRAPGPDQDADEFLAEQFRREYMEAAQDRLAAAKKAPATTSAKGKEDDTLKGPKLGGSRSTRAAYHAREKEKAASSIVRK